jgi:hypothetical protein
MSETFTPTYTGLDGTYLDVPAPPAGAPKGAIVLNVSGAFVGLGPMAALRVIDLLSEFRPSIGLAVACGTSDEGPYLDVLIREHTVKVGVRFDSTTTHEVTIPRDQLSSVVSEIHRKGVER